MLNWELCSGPHSFRSQAVQSSLKAFFTAFFLSQPLGVSHNSPSCYFQFPSSQPGHIKHHTDLAFWMLALFYCGLFVLQTVERPNNMEVQCLLFVWVTTGAPLLHPVDSCCTACCLRWLVSQPAVNPFRKQFVIWPCFWLFPLCRKSS